MLYRSGFYTYDHRTLKTRLPVRSALFKQRTGGLVVRWVTTSEYPLLYVFVFLRTLSRNAWLNPGRTCAVRRSGKWGVTTLYFCSWTVSLSRRNNNPPFIHRLINLRSWRRRLTPRRTHPTRHARRLRRPPRQTPTCRARPRKRID
jgi:hypothetical protein